MDTDARDVELRSWAGSELIGADLATERVGRPSQAERARVGDLPHLMDRIQAMGLTEEYMAFRNRYMGWRQGGVRGASGELRADELRSENDFGYWYPTMQVWQWRRTMSYWIAVTFFQGSLFFAISSFLACWSERLGRLQTAVTTFGMIGGKINFFTCTYLMCLETINLSNADHHEAGDQSSDDLSSDTRGDSGSERLHHDEESFMFWPFHARMAVGKLKTLGIGPWPYYASVIYFLGVLVFGVGLAAEFVTSLPEDVSERVLQISFLIGSIMFALGGLFECIENEVFTTCTWDQGYVGALLNLLGGLGFFVGAVIAFFPGQSFASNFIYGLASVIYALGSAVMIAMWKDEQFGLTFLAVLNHLGGPHGRPMVMEPGAKSPDELRTMSTRATIFIIIYILTGVASFYDFLITLANVHGIPWDAAIENAFNALLPCIFSHFVLILNSGVYRTPRLAPFRQLYVMCRYVAVLMMANNIARMVQELATEIEATRGG